MWPRHSKNDTPLVGAVHGSGVKASVDREYIIIWITRRVQYARGSGSMRTPTGWSVEEAGAIAFRQAMHECGWIVRELARPDVGCDYQIEEVVSGEATGLQGQVQLKSRSKPVIVGDAFRFLLDKKHLEYWLGSSMPTLLVLYDGQSRLCYWQAVTEETIRSSKRNSRFIEIPFGHV